MMSAIKCNKHCTGNRTGICPGQARPIEDVNKQGDISQSSEPDNFIRIPKRKSRGRPFEPIQKWTPCESTGTATVSINGCIAVVDLADLHTVNQYRWFLLKRDENTYAATGQGMLMHRMVVGATKGDGKKIDHQDCNGLNCCRYNLRVTTQTGNGANRRKHKKTRYDFKGVRLRNGRIMAEISKTENGVKKQYRLGYFPTVNEAARAYDRKAIELFGEFARLNFPAPALEQGRAA